MWTARAFDDDEVIEPGERVQVIEIRGATALVTEVREAMTWTPASSH